MSVETQIEDLPDEILIYIFKKLDNVEVLYSLMDVNRRFNRIVYEKIFTRDLCLGQYCPFSKSVVPLPVSILDHYCSKILPTIGDRIKSLLLEGSSIERVLRASYYPNLNNLTLLNITGEMAVSLFFGTGLESVRLQLNDGNPLNHLFRNQIMSLFITLNDENLSHTGDRFLISTDVFQNIIATFPELRCLKLNPNASFDEHNSFIGAPVIPTNSPLLELHVSLVNMDECLYLLDHSFDQLRILHVTLYECLAPFDTDINSEKPFPNLRIFSLACEDNINDFDKTIVLILRRMLNLEELQLDIMVECDNKFIDGVTIKKDILMYLPRLSKLTFNICSIMNHDNQMNVLLNEDIEKTFEDFSHDKIITSIDYFEEERRSQCHIYTYPYIGRVYNDITNRFQGGLFMSVLEISLRDQYPFELEFFLQIAKSFPFMKKLTINNRKARNKKEFSGANNSNAISIIEYPHLTRLDLSNAHDDYIELFLFDTNICFPNNLRIYIDYQTLRRVVQRLTKCPTSNNCEKVAALYFSGETVNHFDELMKIYFPHTRIANSFDFF